MGFGRKLRKTLRKAVKVAAVGAAVYYTGGAALAAFQRSQKAPPEAPQGPGFYNAAYSAPFNPGYSYGGAPEHYGGGAFQSFAGTGGAAVPIEQSSGEARSPGFNVTPIMAITGLGVLLLGILAFRR